MSITSTDFRTAFSGNGVTTSFSTGFQFDESADIMVLLTDALGATTLQDLGTDYTVSGGDMAIGTVTMVVAPASGETLTIINNPLATQEFSFDENSPFPAQDFEDALDRVSLVVARCLDLASRSLRLDDSDGDDGVDLILPKAANRASKFLAFDADGNPIASDGGIDADLPVSAFIETLLDDANASAALTTLGFSTYGKTLIDDADASAAQTTLGISTFIKTLLDDADAATARATLHTPDAAEALSNKSLTIPIINGIKKAVTTATGATYVALTSDCLIAAAAGTTTAITLPAATGNARTEFEIIKTDANFTPITIGDGTFSTTIDTQGECVVLRSNGTTYHIINRRINSAWIAYTPTGSWSTNTTHAAFYRRVGDSLQVRAYTAVSGAPTSAAYTLNLPSGLAVDTAKLPNAGDANNHLGDATIRDAGTQTFTGRVFYDGASAVAVRYEDDGSGGVAVATAVTQAAPMTWANGDNMFINFEVPISGWKG